MVTGEERCIVPTVTKNVSGIENMLELKKVTIGKEEKRAHICIPCYCGPNPCTPMVSD